VTHVSLCSQFERPSTYSVSNLWLDIGLYESGHQLKAMEVWFDNEGESKQEYRRFRDAVGERKKTFFRT
jgi:hypothetical protein